jgi:hypothetical protein
MKNPRKILRPKATYEKCGCGKTKFDEDYRHHSDDDPFVPGTNIPRVKAVFLGPRNVGFIEHELDALIDALVKAGEHAESKGTRKGKGTRTTRVFLTDAKPRGCNRDSDPKE